MTDGVEEAGALLTAGAAASVLEPGKGGKGAHPDACLNCGAALSGAFCAQCGQRAHLHRSLGDAAHELLHGVLHFDSKLWNTLPLLLVRPGKLTREYVLGRRVRFISPVALFLLTFFLMFLLFGYVSPPKIVPPQGGVDRAESIAEMDASIKGMADQIAEAKADPARHADIAPLVETHESLLKMRARVEKGDSPDVVETVFSTLNQQQLNIKSGDVARDEKIRNMIRDPSFLFYKMKQKGYKLGFLLIPLTLPWLWILFCWRRDVRAYDHVVFLLYSLSFVSLLVMAMSGVVAAGFGNFQLFFSVLSIVPLIHMFVQMKEAYALGWGGALWRTIVLASGAFFTLVAYIVAIVMLGVLD